MKIVLGFLVVGVLVGATIWFGNYRDAQTLAMQECIDTKAKADNVVASPLQKDKLYRGVCSDELTANKK